jgi:Bacterial membrane protein YfhO
VVAPPKAPPKAPETAPETAPVPTRPPRPRRTGPPQPPPTDDRERRRATPPRTRTPREPLATRVRPLAVFADVERRLPLLAVGLVAFAVLAFSRGWGGGRLSLDGPGVSMHLRLALEQWRGSGGVPYWLAEMWTGSPVWALAPSLPTLELLPLATAVGPETAVRVAIVAAQVVGGWGTYVLATALWGRRSVPAAVAGLLYALHPLFITHGALFGHETSAWVMAATPWLAWTFRKALKGEGAGYVIGAGLVAGFAVLHQAEHAYSLAVMCLCMLAVELAKARSEARARGAAATSATKAAVGFGEAARGLLARAGGAAAVAAGSTAFWLLPFLALTRSFVLTPPASVKVALQSAALGHRPSAWLSRSAGLDVVPTFEALSGGVARLDGLLQGTFYLSWVCVALTIVTVFLLARHDHDGHLTAILVASAVGIWMSSSGVSLAVSQLGSAGELLPLVVLGVVAGLLVSAFVRHLDLNRSILAGVVTAAFLVAMPYLTPFTALQRLVPFLSSIRFPRFYPLAALGLALGAAYPLVVCGAWARRRRPDLAGGLVVALSLAVAGAFLVDIGPYRSYYRGRPPDGEAAYRQASAMLMAAGGSFRVAVPFVDPRPVAEMSAIGQRLTTGWPHPVASKQAWRMTAEPFVAPQAFRDVAFGLSGTAYTAVERLSSDSREVEGVELFRNPDTMPLVRAYESVVVARDETVAPELAVALAPRGVGVVTGDDRAARAVGAAGSGTVTEDTCAAGARLPPGDLGREVAMACAMHRWVGVYNNQGTVNVSSGGGGVFLAPLDDLQGVSVWLDRPPGDTELILWEVGPDGRSLLREVTRAVGVGSDGRDMTTFAFDALPGSGGRRYAFFLSCPRCPPGQEPRMVAADAERGPGNLQSGGRVNTERVAAFSLVYDGMRAAEPSTTAVRAVSAKPGSWEIESSGRRAAVVVVAEAMFPGWRAKVDGRPAPVLTADGAFLGVAVPPGDHHVTLTYQKPTVALVGGWITIFTLLGVLLFVLVRRKGSDAEPAAR